MPAGGNQMPKLLDQCFATPGIFFSGDGYDVTEWLDRGMIDFGTLIELVDLSGDTCLCFRPLEPRLESWMYLAWKKYQVFTSAAEVFLDYLKKSPSVALYME